MWSNGFEKLLEDPKGLQTFAVSSTFRFILFIFIYYVRVTHITLNVIDFIQGILEEGV